jgi:hypothetical protein
MTEPLQMLRALHRLVFTLALVFFVSAIAQAQQPFVTDDADVNKPKELFGRE